MSELKILLITGLLCFVLGIVTVSIECRNLGSLFLLASVLVFIGLYWLNDKYKLYIIEYLPNDKVSEIQNHSSFEFYNEYLDYRYKDVIQKINGNGIFNI